MSKRELIEIIDKFKDKKILVIGDLILDHYAYGTVSRISPEAPVPIVHIKSEEYKLGGAANVAANIATLSGNITLIGLIGRDRKGKKVIDLCKKNKIKIFPEYFHRTIKKTRIIAENQQLVRIDEEQITNKDLNPRLIKKEAEKADIIIISDYAKGAISPNLMKLLTSLNKRIVVDPKPKNKSLYQGVYLITPKQKEATEMSSFENVYKAGEQLQRELNTNVIITKGKQGMSIFNNGIKDIPTFAKEVYDVTGAGDTVIATLSLALASGANLEESAILANHAAGIAVGKPGTARVYLEELKNEIEK